MENSLEPIAVVGVGCRFPGASTSPSKFWDLLRQPRDVAGQIPRERFNVENFYHPSALHHGTGNTKVSYFLEDNIRNFDAGFFGVKPAEASAIDPQQRLLLEVVYEAVERAGLDVERLRGSDTAVYSGVMCGDYENLLLRDLDNLPRYHATGIGRSLMSNRISYLFDWKGPSITLDTACSSSLVAVHEAVQVLRSGRSRVAIATGSNLILGPENYVAESNLNMLSPDGRSHMWDAQANGYARGEGVAAVVLKKLSTAIEDGDVIDCVIRNTGVNQDGRTQGITMPNATSQSDLIHRTYSEVGLDCTRDRPQYFEAHGTGTPAGDPIEAEAIHDVFFRRRDNRELASRAPERVHQKQLLVGSVKTVIGHSEGCAGLAALIKASLCLQHGQIAPNMYFNQLNPTIAPFYTHLEVPKLLTEWPAPPTGQPRRASVNSFGFGGTNAHAILETYEPSITARRQARPDPDTEAVPLPFVLSAATRPALHSLVASYRDYLIANTGLHLPDLAWTFCSRRTVHQARVAYTSASQHELVGEMNISLEATQLGVVTPDHDVDSGLRVLGVFTGQGAQWVGMGRELVEKSPWCQSIIEKLDGCLSRLPQADRPDWTIRDQLLSTPTKSRLTEASFSQPICTAVQILLVDILRVARIQFTAVVGHSSGEIAAAYAASVISAEDAITIAYYRGLHSQYACGKDGQKGSMLALSGSREDAERLVSASDGRLSVAAYNSASSITISGDESAIYDAKSKLDASGIFSRVLKVDTAYHSHHMKPCYQPYLDAVQQRQLPPPSESTCMWFSSVHAGQQGQLLLKENPVSYWMDNMVRPVHYHQALQASVANAGSFDIAIEIGPHPALKTPSLSTLGKEDLIYTGILDRNMSAFSAVSKAMGILWQRMGSQIDLASLQSCFTGQREFLNLCRELPTYAWEHQKQYWHESRRSRITRSTDGARHELLGRLCPDTTTQQMSWRNFLTPKEVPWLDGHQLQGQTVFPAAGYLVLALDACRVVAECDGKALDHVELTDITFHQAIILGTAEKETLFSFTDMKKDDVVFTAKFAVSVYNDRPDEIMSLAAEGRVTAWLTDRKRCTISRLNHNIKFRSGSLTAIEDADFYEYLDSTGYNYSGPFRTLRSLKRKLNSATGTLRGSIAEPEGVDPGSSNYIIHPAALDSAFQVALLAFGAPYDGRLWSIHVPISIKRIIVDSAMLATATEQDQDCFVAAALNDDHEIAISADLDICIIPPGGQSQTAVQIEGLYCTPLAPSTGDEGSFFTETSWGVMTPDVSRVTYDSHPTAGDRDLALTMERVCFYYLRLLDKEIPQSHAARTQGPYVSLFDYATMVLDNVASGIHPYIQQEWSADQQHDIERISRPFAETVDVRMAHAAGANFREVIRGNTTILEHMRKDGLLDRYYEDALAFPTMNKYLGRTVAQLSHRFPHLDILEIGAGTGSATKVVMRELRNTYRSYTYTDISSGFFPTATRVFADHSEKMQFKVLDIGRPPADQGFADHSYDLVVASFVLHATPKLRETMLNVRRLLRPGGFLVMLEVTNNEPVRMGAIFGCLPGWWLGKDDGRIYSPCIDLQQWDVLLSETGFNGVASVSPELDKLAYPVSLVVSQAVDDRMRSLQDPLAPPCTLPDALAEYELLIIDGKETQTSQLARDIQRVFSNRCQTAQILGSLEDVSQSLLKPETAIICLCDIDNAVFRNLTKTRWNALKHLFGSCRLILWVSRGCQSSNPHANITLGFARTYRLEALGRGACQFVDLDSIEPTTAQLLSRQLAQMAWYEHWKNVSSAADLLWTSESEVRLRCDQILVPRLKSDTQRNDRRDAALRTIRKKIDPSKTVVLGRSSKRLSSITMYEVDRIPCAVLCRDEDATQVLEMCVHFSAATPLVLGPERIPLSLIGGTVAGTADVFAVALSTVQASAVRIPRGSMELTLFPFDGAKFAMLASSLLAITLLGSVRSYESVLVYGADVRQADALCFHARIKSIKVTFANEDSTATASLDCIRVSPLASDRSIRQLLPKSFSHFLSLAPPLDQTAQRMSAIIDFRGSALYHERQPVDVSEICTAKPSSPDVTGALALESLREVLRASLPYSEAPPPLDDTKPTIAGLGSDASKVLHHQPDAIVDWQTPRNALVEIQPVELGLKLRPDRTYWLQGLSGSLGLSLAEWMIKLGARYLVISSRSPRCDPEWLQEMAIQGATVKILSCDVTSRSSVKEAFAQILSELPPLSGVTQGAMVLNDGVVSNLEFEAVMDVLRPKVDGSIYLNEVLGNTPLDFFVFFSSGAFVTGRMGQANYTAANAFVVSLAQHRRYQGLAASVLHLGPVIGVGYVERIDQKAVREGLIKTGFRLMSEIDLHVAFAEAVVASQPDSGYPMEVTAGVRHFSPDDPEKPVWKDEPRLSHLCIQSRATVQLGSPKTSVPLKDQIRQCQSVTSKQDMLQDALLKELNGPLQLAVEPNGTWLSRRVDSYGIDSLIAVEIRAWFSKALGVDVPVLRILGGCTFLDLVEQAMAEFDPGTPLELAEQSHPENPRAIGDESSDNRSNPPLCINMPNLSPSSYQSSDQAEPKPPSSSRDSDKDTASSHETSHSTDTSSHGLTEPEFPSPAGKPSELSPNLEPSRVEPISYGQATQWSVHSLLEDPTTLNHTAMYRITGEISVKSLERAVRVVGREHESLRTRFVQTDTGDVQQEVMGMSTMQLEVVQAHADAEVEMEFEKMRAHVFRLELGETTRIRLIQMGPARGFLVLGCHHINMDGMSMNVVIAHLKLAYLGQSLPRNILQYPDHARRQLDGNANGIWNGMLADIRARFQPLPPVLPLFPIAQTAERRPLLVFSHHRRDVHLEEETCRKISIACGRAKCTPFQFYLAAYRLLLYRLSGAHDDLCIGTCVAARVDDHTMQCIGPLMNPVPLLFKGPFRAQATADELMTETKNVVHTALATADVPFQLVLQELKVSRSLTHSPLFQAFINYRPGLPDRIAFRDFDMELGRFDAGRTAYDVGLDVLDKCHDGGCTITVMAQQSLYSETATETLATCYQHIVEQLAAFTQETFLTRMQQFPSELVTRAMQISQGPLRDSQWQMDLPARLRHIAQKFDDKVAVKDGYDVALTYEAMMTRADLICERMRGLGVAAGSAVCVFQQPSAGWICSMVAILLLGGIYVPLDPGNHLDQLARIVRDCRPRAVLVQQSTAEAAKTHLLKHDSCLKLLQVDEEGLANRGVIISSASRDLAQSCKTQICSDDAAAAILYTSGSTGSPKGIVLTHGNLINEVEQSASVYGFDHNDVVLQQSALSFDMSLTQIFCGIAYGATLIIPPLALRGDARALTATMAYEGVTLTAATPSEYTAWLTYGAREDLVSVNWRIAISGGEKIDSRLVQQFRHLGKTELRVFNAYGPTEVTCSASRLEINLNDLSFSAEARVGTQDTISAGFPAPNSSIYVVDESSLEPVPLGWSGEVVIGGAGVARGYLGHDEENKARFVENRWCPDEYKVRGWTKMHRTGDRGRWLEDGTLLIQGRIADEETQIKLAGVRVDLRGIEATIVELGSHFISEAVVTLRQTAAAKEQEPGDERNEHAVLVAHVVARSSATNEMTTPQALELFRKHTLASRLPQRLLPTFVLPLGHAARTLSGKLDRRAVAQLALPPVLTALETDDKAELKPQLSPFAAELLELWKAVVPGLEIMTRHMTKITPATDFFDVGGNSLLLVKLQARLSEHYDVRIPLHQLFEFSALEGMSLRVQQARGCRGLLPLPTSVVDWEAETEVPEAWVTQLPDNLSDTDSRRRARRVVLTGATGFLGRQLLTGLLARHDVDHVYCVAVRDQAKLFPIHSKMSVYAGDLSQPRLGLSAADADAVFAAADVIIHCGCQVSHMRSYASLKAANYESLRQLLRLALPRRLPFHLISSAEVSLLSGRDTWGPWSAASFPPPSDASGVDGYTACKWASERLLEKAHTRAGLPVTIYRPTSITSSAEGGVGPSHDLWQDLMHYSRKLLAVPESPLVRGTVNFVDVHVVVNTILHRVLGLEASLSTEADPPHEVCYANIFGKVHMPLEGLRREIARDTGSEVAQLSLASWAEAAKRAGMSHLVAQFFASVEASGRWVFPNFVA
ncbi:hybrid polyketide synthase [Microdochium nivale]|nr:hybrid polyketide synthase [Microdochium nivale]